MLTNEKILDVFAGLLNEDKDREVMKTRHGYITVLWHEKRKEYDFLTTVLTPRQLLTELMSDYVEYRTYLLTDGKRDLTKAEKAAFKKEAQVLKQKCLEEENLVLTFERVEEVFAKYIREVGLEIVPVAHGRLILQWSPRGDFYQTNMLCITPDNLLNALVGLYSSDLVSKKTHGLREATADEVEKANEQGERMRAECLKGI